MHPQHGKIWRSRSIRLPHECIFEPQKREIHCGPRAKRLSYSSNRISIYNHDEKMRKQFNLVEDHTCFIQEVFKQEKAFGAAGEKGFKRKTSAFRKNNASFPCSSCWLWLLKFSTLPWPITWKEDANQEDRRQKNADCLPRTIDLPPSTFLQAFP